MRLALLGIVMGVSVMIISISILNGFREQIQNKIIGFGSHIQITRITSSSDAEPEKLLIDRQIIKDVLQLDYVDHIQIYATKGGLIENDEGLEGIIVKGVDDGYKWEFIEQNLVEGRVIHFNDSMPSNELIISQKLADLMALELGEKVSVYFINDTEDFRQRNFEVIGIYETDLLEFDSKQVFADIKHIQKINGWGIEAQVLVSKTDDQHFEIEAFGFGGEGDLKFSWNNNWQGNGPFKYSPSKDTLIHVAVSDINDTKPDTAFIQFNRTESTFNASTYTSGSSYYNYIGGYEVLLNDISNIDKKQIEIDNLTNFELTTDNFFGLNPELFSWLEMIGVNANIIIILMVIVAIVNMTSTLIIIILEKTNLIGLLKSLGIEDWGIRKIFLYNSIHLIGKGILVGNIIALSFLWIQHEFKIIKLDADSYSVSEVPVGFPWEQFLILDIATLMVCTVALIIPSWLISFISPVKALRFD